jgi:hypothetical protein
MTTVYLPDSETYLAIKEDEIVGFIAMAENFLMILIRVVNE